MSNGGIEADTEESMTSEEEPDKRAIAALDCLREREPTTTKEKWIAVKGHPAPPSPLSSSSDT